MKEQKVVNIYLLFNNYPLFITLNAKYKIRIKKAE